MTQPQKMLGIGDIRKQFSLGRDLATRLAELLPHVTAGRVGTGVKRLVHSADIERVMVRASAESADLWALVRQDDAREVLAHWLADWKVN